MTPSRAQRRSAERERAKQERQQARNQPREVAGGVYGQGLFPGLPEMGTYNKKGNVIVHQPSTNSNLMEVMAAVLSGTV